MYYTWSKAFLYAGKRCLFSDTAGAATTDQVKVLRRETRDLKEVVAEQTLEQLAIPRQTFYRWYDRFQRFGIEGLEGRLSASSRVWNSIPDDVRDEVIELAVEEPKLRAARTDDDLHRHKKAISYQKRPFIAYLKPMT